MTDVELVQRALADPEDYAAIINQFQAGLLRFIQSRSRLCRADAEDIVQQVFIKAYEHLNDYDAEFKLSTWLFQIARNEVISHWRKRKARPQTFELDEVTLDSWQQIAARMGEDFDLKLQSRGVHAILDFLKPDYRDVLYLYYFAERSYTEIADILKKPNGSIATLLYRAKKAFHKFAERQNLTIKLTTST